MISPPNEYEYSKFEDWFNETEGFSFRSERFYSFFENDTKTQEHLKLWLRAAFDSARLENDSIEKCGKFRKCAKGSGENSERSFG